MTETEILAEHHRRMASLTALQAEIIDIQAGCKADNLTEKGLARINERLDAVKIKLRVFT
ncbi:hypothetical protein SAMN04488498_12383 [Mesorhizobium albiziae]|uniref:Uncharacterized protein n=1 Tax=Neomesorhizobium albiziae TaxID=335020 RepID=A0A1I4E7M8_9HYPH|nr:hypothetical protein [Mesorhizobium albiziae]GLS33793.1 hypothetical protein GCM10007937_55060 [Mesorhizobium albiziae]SFL01834.1 hypothetical protein SAMN04488498_12383 [Mesorhizobium albiziae]